MKLTIRFVALLRIAVSVLTCFMASYAWAARVSDVSITIIGQKTKIEVHISEKISANVFALDNGSNRIVIDLDDIEPSPKITGLTQTPLSGSGAVTQIRTAYRGKGIRLVADLASSAKYISHSYKNEVLRVWIEGGVENRAFTGVVYPRLKPSLTSAPKTVETKVIRKPVPKLRVFAGTPTPRLKNGRGFVARKPVIVIDPGHGGYDPGAIGVTNVKEEYVTLKAAQELRRQLLKTGKYKVVLTRDSDKYVDHEVRVRIARMAGADLFISLHADSLARPETRGASVYTLAARAKSRRKEIIHQQNWVHNVDLTRQSGAVSDILVNLAQRKTLTKSAQFADILVPQLKKRTILLGNTHRQAGLYVLLAPDVPAVLLEMGFMSNKKDEKLLNSAKHRAKLMKSVTESINLYFKKQSTLQLGS
ncbi:MAG: N-acetylmuramoyl-L-alanine amidase [Robiginitomaculum sp.]|nr:MAG: N-acetylmuramoyl-L-alanine amidase [Robiginitomaculum sp.]